MICTNSFCSSDTSSFRGNVYSIIINLRNNVLIVKLPHSHGISHMAHTYICFCWLYTQPIYSGMQMHMHGNHKYFRFFPRIFYAPWMHLSRTLTPPISFGSTPLLQEPQSCKSNIFGEAYLVGCGIKGWRTHDARYVPLVMHGIHY